MTWAQQIKGCCVVWFCMHVTKDKHEEGVTDQNLGLVSVYFVAAALSTFNSLMPSSPDLIMALALCVKWICVLAQAVVCLCAWFYTLVTAPYLHVLNSCWCVGLRQCVWWRGCLHAKLKWSVRRTRDLSPLKNPIALLTAAADQR